MNHSRWRTARERALRGEVEPPRIAAQREQIRLAMDLGQLVYDRRKALGLSEEDLAGLLGTDADEVEAIEVGGVLPLTSELLSRIAAALRVDVDVRWNADGAVVRFDDRAA